MKVVYLFFCLYIIIFFIDYFILKNLGKYKINEFDYMKKRYKLKIKKIKHIKIITSMLNALIMSIVSTLIIALNLPLYINLPLAFILIIILIYTIYGIYGNYLRSKKNEPKRKK